MWKNVGKNTNFRYNVWNICLPEPPHPKDQERNPWRSHQGLGLIFLFLCISFLIIGATASWIQGLRLCRGRPHHKKKHFDLVLSKIVKSFHFPGRLGLMEQRKPMESLWSRAPARWHCFKIRCFPSSLLCLKKITFILIFLITPCVNRLTAKQPS